MKKNTYFERQLWTKCTFALHVTRQMRDAQQNPKRANCMLRCFTHTNTFTNGRTTATVHNATITKTTHTRTKSVVITTQSRTFAFDITRIAIWRCLVRVGFAKNLQGLLFIIVVTIFALQFTLRVAGGPHGREVERSTGAFVLICHTPAQKSKVFREMLALSVNFALLHCTVTHACIPYR